MSPRRPDEPFGDRMERVLRKRLRRLLDAASGTIERGRSDELHALRIAVKRLRYNMEFVVSIVPRESAEALALLALLQERLGAVADADAFDRTYRELLAKLPAGDERRAGVETLRAAAERDGTRAVAGLRALWQSGQPPYPERLAVSISAALGSLSPNDDP